MMTKLCERYNVQELFEENKQVLMITQLQFHDILTSSGQY